MGFYSVTHIATHNSYITDTISEIDYYTDNKYFVYTVHDTSIMLFNIILSAALLIE